MRVKTSLLLAAMLSVVTAAPSLAANPPPPGAPIKMLPPTDFSGAVCSGPTAGLLFWDGVNPIRCVPRSGGDATGKVTAKTLSLDGARLGALGGAGSDTANALSNMPACPNGQALTKTGPNSFSCVAVNGAVVGPIQCFLIVGSQLNATNPGGTANGTIGAMCTNPQDGRTCTQVVNNRGYIEWSCFTPSTYTNVEGESIYMNNARPTRGVIQW